MADEKLAPQEELETIDALVEGDDEVEIASPPTIDDYARSRGWTTKEEWVEAGKPEDDWRDAEEFLNFGLDRSKDMGRDLKELRGTVESMRSANVIAAREAAAQARAQERAKWEQVHDEAVELGDKDAAKQAVENIAKVSAPAEPQVDPLVQQFRADNPWFNTDPVAQSVAIATAEQNKHLPIPDQLAAAKKAVESRFPEYAPKQETKPAKAVEVAQPSGTARPPKRGKTFHDLPKENQEAARALQEADMLPGGLEGYVKNYFNKEGTVI